MFSGKSAMKEQMCMQLIRGRPFGGVGVMSRRSLGSVVTYYGCSDDSRVVVIQLENGSQNMLVLAFTSHAMMIDLNICIAFNRYSVILNLFLRRISAISVLSSVTSILNSRLLMSGSVSSLSLQVDSAFYPPWDGKMSTSQTAVMLCGWGVKAGMV